jgi:hypothetical protein
MRDTGIVDVFDRVQSVKVARLPIVRRSVHMVMLAPRVAIVQSPRRVTDRATRTVNESGSPSV